MFLKQTSEILKKMNIPNSIWKEATEYSQNQKQMFLVFFFQAKSNLCQMSHVLWDWSGVLALTADVSHQKTYMSKHFVVCVFLETCGDSKQAFVKKNVFSDT